MTDGHKTILKTLGLIVSASLGYVYYYYFKDREKVLQKFETFETIDIIKLNKLKPGEQAYIRAKISKKNNSNQVQRSIPIYYNDYYMEEPSDIKVVRQLNYEQNWQPIFKDQVWNIVDPIGNQCKIYKIKEIVGDPYSIDRKYQSKTLGILAGIWGGACFMFQLLFDGIRKVNFHNQRTQEVDVYRSPLIKGPLVGHLHYAVGLATEAYFVLKIKFEDGILGAEILAESRNTLLNHFKSQVNSALTGFIISAGISLFLIRSLSKDFKRSSLYADMRASVHKNRLKFLTKQDPLPQESCIICYNNCRNLIIFDCRHLVLCWDCWDKEIKYTHCPICKGQITQGKPISYDNNPFHIRQLENSDLFEN